MANVNKGRGGKLRELSSQEDAVRQNSLKQQQDEQQELRLKYQVLSAKLKDHQDKGGLHVGKLNFETVLDEANEMCPRASRPREQLQDADVLETLSFSLKVEARKMLQQEGSSPADFVSALCSMFGLPANHNNGELDDDEGDAAAQARGIDWARMGAEHAVDLMRPAITFGTMLGPLEAEAPKGRAIGQRRCRDVIGERVMPDEMAADADAERNDREREEETQARVAKLFKAIKVGRKRRRAPVPVVPLLVDPESFSRTVENVFALSFLIKEGRCQLTPVQGSSPVESLVVEAKNAPTEEETASGQCENSQFLLRLEYSDWERLKQAVESLPAQEAA